MHEEYGLHLEKILPETSDYDALILTVGHDDVAPQGAEELRKRIKAAGVLFDMKAAFGVEESDLRL